MGYIRTLIAPEHESSKWLLLEAVARSLKSNINQLLRERMLDIGVPADEPFRHIILTIFNLALGKNGQLSKQYWNRFVKTTVATKYPQLLTPEEQADTFDLQANVCLSHGLTD
jgi:hypothetical protein